MKYKRTNRKEFVQQLARIERRQARIRQMCPQNSATELGDEERAARPEVHHAIGQSENFPEHLSLFVQKHSGDPAIEVCALVIPDFFRILELL